MTTTAMNEPVFVGEEEEGPDAFDVAVQQVTSMLKSRPTLLPKDLFTGYVIPLLTTLREGMREEMQDYVEARLESAGVFDEDIAAKAKNLIVGLAAILDGVLVRVGYVDLEGKYLDACPPEVQSAYEQAKAEVQTWSEDYNAYVEEMANAAEDDEDDGEEDDEEEGGDDEEDETEDGEEIAPQQFSPAPAGGV